MNILSICIGVAFSIGLYFILADLFRLPRMSLAKTMRNVGKKGKKKTSSLEIFLNGFATELEGKIRLNEYKKEELREELVAAGMREITPEFFISNAIVKAGFVAIFALPAFFILKILSLGILLVAVVIYFKETKGIVFTIKKKRAAIEAELPKFVGFLSSQLKYSRNLQDILMMYKKSAGEQLKDELEITIADMNTSNEKEALLRFGSRINSIRLNEVVQKLRDVVEGHYSETAWVLMKETFSALQKQDLKMQAKAVPRKMRKNSIALLFCFILIYVVVLGQVLITSLGTIF